MKRNILLAIAVVFTLSIGAAVYAFNSTSTTTNSAAVSCCCKGDSCPMKSKDAKASADAKESCCKDDCCKGDSCPMKKGDASTTATAAGTATAADAKHSCPMMKDGKMSAEHHKDMKGMNHADMKDGHEGCSCVCCGHDKAKTETPAV